MDSEDTKSNMKEIVNAYTQGVLSIVPKLAPLPIRLPQSFFYYNALADASARDS